MNSHIGPRALVVAGVALFALMAFLLSEGTTSGAQFITWGMLAIAGVGLVGYGRKLENDRRQAALDADRHRRRQARESQ